jgi:hypothetical protein
MSMLIQFHGGSLAIFHAELMGALFTKSSYA